MLISGALLLTITMCVIVGIVYFFNRPEVKLIAPLMIYFCLHAGYYAAFHRIEFRYILPPLLVFFVPATVVAAAAAQRWRSVQRLAPFILVTMLIVITQTGLSAYRQGMASVRVHKFHYVAKDMAEWLAREHPNAVVGAWNAGVLSFFSNTELVNLDGVVNDHALRANSNRRIDDYILERGIQLIVDEPSQIMGNLEKFAKDPTLGGRLGEIVYQVVDSEGRTLVAHRVRSAGQTN